MQSSLLTDERLRSWLDSNQIQRERMCIAILALNKKYSNIKPRRPRGGPDGGRDIEALYEAQFEAWGGIGFRNSAKDSSADKRWVLKKYAEDLEKALQQQPLLKAFFFFTNVDLTPTEEEILKQKAHHKGVLFADIFYRERLRITLDSPEGLAARFLYLGIPLSDAEQATFFDRFGTQIQDLITDHFSSMEKRLERLEFLQQRDKPIQYILSYIKLIEPTFVEDLGHFRFLTNIRNINGNELFFYGRDFNIWSDYSQSQIYGSKNLVFTRGDYKYIEEREVHVGIGKMDALVFGGYMNINSAFKHISDFDDSYINFRLSKPLFTKATHIGVIVNDYLIFEAPIEECHTAEYLEGDIIGGPVFPLTPAEILIPWVDVYHRDPGIENPIGFMPFRTNFTRSTPKLLPELIADEFRSYLAVG